MTFWKGFKSAFGFSPDTDDESEEYDTSLPTYAVPTPEAPAQPETTPSDETPEGSAPTAAPTAPEAPAAPAPTEGSTDGDTDLPADMLDAVIEIFNATQPEFVSRCLNIQAQREYLLQSFSASLRQRISQALTPAPTVNPDEHRQLLDRLAALEAQAKDMDKLRQDNSKLRQNLERQKRSMLDQVKDLQSQVAALQAEKEKYYTTRTARSNADKEALALANARLEETQAQVQAHLDDIATLKATLDDAHARLEAERTQYQETCSQQELALQQIQQQVEAFSEIKGRLEARIIQQKDTVRKGKEALEAEQQAHAATAARLDRMARECSQWQAKAQNAPDSDALQTLKEQYEGKMAQLRDDNRQLQSTIENNLYNQAHTESRLRNEIKQLRHQLEDATASKANATVPKEVKQVIEANETKAIKEVNGTQATIPLDTRHTGAKGGAAPVEATSVAIAAEAAPAPKRRKTRARKSATAQAITDTPAGQPSPTQAAPIAPTASVPATTAAEYDELDNTDWFSTQVTAPAAAATEQRPAATQDAEFGYHEPPRRPSNENSAQLSLF